MATPTIEFILTSPLARKPVRSTEGAAGYDLYSAEKCTIAPGTRYLVPTDVKIQLPPNTFGHIAPRSGLALKHSIDIGAGIIDEDYRGTLGILMINHGTTAFEVELGDKVGQLLIQYICHPDFKQVENFSSVTKRGEGGFGSTGRK